ncbi:MAG: aminoglycoside phosphotransferase family protein [Thermosynechococcaceae cyanobacterium MS004]|nr:aminoglycoside phosphotransferase family protein [Thermosynechococcaceae cyanobacterium MS004]
MLEHSEVLSYLLEKQWLDSEAVVQDQLQIVNLSRRNCNFKVVGTHSPCYFLKQGNGEVGIGTVSHEASIYQFFQQSSCLPLQSYLTPCLGYEEIRQILTLSFIQDAQDLRTYQVKHGRFTKQIATEMAKAIACLHGHFDTSKSINNQVSPDLFQDCTPWVLNAHRPQLSVLRTISEATLKLMRMIQKFPDFGDRLDALSQSWQQTALIHGDIKFENFIVHRVPSRRKTQLKLVDWEFAGIGDPCWDIGSVFSTYLRLWILSIPITGEVPPTEFAKLAEYPLEKMQGAIAIFWQTYCHQMAFTSIEADGYLLKSVQLGAARLIQSALELTDLGRLTSTVVCLLQLSLNILQKPERAATQLLGIPRGEV